MNRVADDLTPSESQAERLLEAFYEREVPRPWPAFVPPARTSLSRPPEPRRRSALGSRLALALSVALLLACGWLLAGGGASKGPSRSGVPIHFKDGNANRDQGGHHAFPDGAKTP